MYVSNTLNLQSIHYAARFLGGFPKFAHISGYSWNSLSMAPIQKWMGLHYAVQNPFPCAQLLRWGGSNLHVPFCTLVSSLPAIGLTASFQLRTRGYFVQASSFGHI